MSICLMCSKEIALGETFYERDIFWMRPGNRPTSTYGTVHKTCYEGKIPEHPPAESLTHKSLPESLDPPAPDPALDLRLDILESLAKMHERRAAVFRLLLQGNTRAEIGQQLDLSHNTVERHIQEARQMLQTSMELA